MALEFVKSARQFYGYLRNWQTAEIQRFVSLRPNLKNIPYWIAAGIVGVVAIVYSGAFSRAIDLAEHVVISQPNAMFLLSPLCLVLAGWLVERFAPAAGGAGIPQVIRALNTDFKTHEGLINEILSLRVAVIIILSSLIAAMGGGGLGREGPVVHIAACLFYFVGKQFHKIWPHEEHRSWIVAGGAAGISAAFNAPLAGVVFVLEELAQAHFHRFKTVVISAAIIGGMVSQYISGRYLYFGFVQVQAVPWKSLFYAVALGLIAAFVAYPFHRLLRVNWRELAGPFRERWRFAAVLGLAVSALAVHVDQRTIGGGLKVIEELLTKPEAEVTWGLIGGRFANTLLTHLSGCAGGFLAPSLSFGAIIGSKFSSLIGSADHNLLVLVGMAAFLSAIVRAPFTAWVIVMEMTNQHYAIFPLMIASIVSHGTVRQLIDRNPT